MRCEMRGNSARWRLFCRVSHESLVYRAVKGRRIAALLAHGGVTMLRNEGNNA